MPYAVAKVKTFRGMEGVGFNADLLLDGRKVCFVIDDANGGVYHYEWASREDEMAFEAFVASLPVIPSVSEQDKSLWPEGRKADADEVVSRLVDDFEQVKKLRRTASKSLMGVRPSDPKGRYSVWRMPVDREAVLRRYPDMEFINDHIEDGRWRELLKLTPVP